MKIHELKFKGRDLCDAVYTGRKVHEIRKNDRDYKVGDLIRPLPIDDSLIPINHPISTVTYEITFVSYSWKDVIKDGYVVMSIKPYNVEVVK